MRTYCTVVVQYATMSHRSVTKLYQIQAPAQNKRAHAQMHTRTCAHYRTVQIACTFTMHTCTRIL